MHSNEIRDWYDSAKSEKKTYLVQGRGATIAQMGRGREDLKGGEVHALALKKKRRKKTPSP